MLLHLFIELDNNNIGSWFLKDCQFCFTSSEGVNLTNTNISCSTEGFFKTCKSFESSLSLVVAFRDRFESCSRCLEENCNTNTNRRCVIDKWMYERCIGECKCSRCAWIFVVSVIPIICNLSGICNSKYRCNTRCAWIFEISVVSVNLIESRKCRSTLCIEENCTLD